MTAVFCSVGERYVNPLFEVFDGGDFVLSSWRDVESDRTEMSVFFPDPADVPAASRALADALGLVGADVPIRVRTFPDEDWKFAYRRHFKTMEISPRLAVVPTWEMPGWRRRHPHGEGPRPVAIDPGMAFGTGQHATTRSCLEYVDEAALADRNRSFLDVGCGSGILAIAAARLGFARVAGFDVDADAVRVANEMAELNGVGRPFARGDLSNLSTLPGMTRVRGVWDVVAANVLGPVLIRFAAEIVPLVAPGGELILSGILDGLYPEVAERYRREGFAEKSSRLAGEWRTGLFVRA